MENNIGKKSAEAPKIMNTIRKITKRSFWNRPVTKRTVLILAAIWLAAMVLFSIRIFPLGDSGNIRLDDREMLTRDLEHTYINGTASVMSGQKITVKSGWKTVAETTLPETGEPGTFSIRVPESEIHKKGYTSFSVTGYMPDSGAKTPRMNIRVKYKPKSKQNIKTDKKAYSLEFPGDDLRIKTTTESKGPLKYFSEDPKVAIVAENGTISPKGVGKTQITIVQTGTEDYLEAKKTVEVSVKQGDAYFIEFKYGDKTETQIVRRDESVALNENPFENEGHDFLGWEYNNNYYSDGESVYNLAERGETAELNAVWSGDGRKAAVAWAIDIANDDSFNYGTGSACHKLGCYFCGTNGGKVSAAGGDKRYYKTYVCLTFVGAAYAHGAEDPEMLRACRNKEMIVSENDSNFSKYSCWTKIGKCSNLSESDLEPGDVIIKWADDNGSGHVCMYIGNGRVAEAWTEGWGPDSIRIADGSSESVNARLRRYGKTSKSYVMRYNKG